MMPKLKPSFHLVLLGLLAVGATLAVSACAGGSPATQAAAPSPAPLPPTAPPPSATPVASSTSRPSDTPVPSDTPAPSPTFVPGPALPVQPGTPVPLPSEPITLANVDRLRELAMWGKGRVEQVAYSPNSQLLAVGTTAGIWLYDARTLAELRFIDTGAWVGSLAFTPDSARIVADVGASTISTWDIATGERLSGLKVREGYQGDLLSSPGSSVISSDANILAASLGDQQVGVWKVANGERLYTLEEQNGIITSLALSPDRALLATGSSDGTFWLRDMGTGKPLHVIEPIPSGAPVFSPTLPDGRVLLAAPGSDGIIRLWDTNTGSLAKSLEKPDPVSPGLSLSFSPEGTNLAAAGYGMAWLWRTSDGQLLRTFTMNDSKMKVVGLAFSPDGATLVSWAWDGIVRRWDVSTGKAAGTLAGFGRTDPMIGRELNVPLVAFSPNGQAFVSNPYSYDIELWDLSSGRLARTLTGHSSYVTNMVLSADGSTLASTQFWGYAVWIWDARTGQRKGAYDVYMDTGYPKSLAISPDGTLVAIADGRDGSGVHSTQTGKSLYALRKMDRWSQNFVFSPDGARLAAVSGPATLTLFQVKNGEVLHTLQTGPHFGCLALSADGATLALGTEKGTIELRDAVTGELKDTLAGAAGDRILSLAFSPDGTLLVAGIWDRYMMPLGSSSPTIQVWSLKSRSLVQSLAEYRATVKSMAFSPDGRLLVSEALDGTARLWGIPPE